MSLRQINTLTETENLTPISFMPDGPQGGKLVLGFTSPEQETQLRIAVDKSGKGFTIKNIRTVADEMHIPVVDH